MELVPASVDQWVEDLREELNPTMEETQLELHTSIDTLASDFREEITYTKDFHEEFKLQIQHGASSKQLKGIDARAAQGVDSSTRTGTGRLRTPTSDGSISWTVFRHQFEAEAVHYNWTPSVKPSVRFLPCRSGLPMSSTGSLKKRRTSRPSRSLKNAFGTRT
jgi:AraC-like DNA-binding protein